MIIFIKEKSYMVDLSLPLDLLGEHWRLCTTNWRVLILPNPKRGVVVFPTNNSQVSPKIISPQVEQSGVWGNASGSSTVLHNCPDDPKVFISSAQTEQMSFISVSVASMGRVLFNSCLDISSVVVTEVESELNTSSFILTQITNSVGDEMILRRLSKSHRKYVDTDKKRKVIHQISNRFISNLLYCISHAIFICLFVFWVFLR